MKKSIAFATGVFLLISPFVAGAQIAAVTTQSSGSTYSTIIALYTQIIQLLQEEIALLQEQHVQKINAPASVTLRQDDIAEVRNESVYFTLQSLTASTATIEVTPVGCWNSFPSDTPPQIRCMIAVMPIPPQTLTIGQRYSSSTYSITLTGISNGEATFSVEAVTAGGLGARCGGNMVNAPVCGTGFHCAPEPGSTLPFGDVGGMCVAN